MSSSSLPMLVYQNAAQCGMDSCLNHSYPLLPTIVRRSIQKTKLELKMDMIINSITVDELYEEILYEILQSLGCDFDNDAARRALFGFVQNAFKMVTERHEAIMRLAKIKNPPAIRLNVEVIEANKLSPKGPNGLVDPFVTLYIESNRTHRYNTSTKWETLSPTWQEHFSLPITGDRNDDSLVIQVWDFDAAETVGEKIGKIKTVKGVKGLRKLIKEVAVTASTGKHEHNELVGKCSIPLQTIPASGLTLWCNLDKEKKRKRQGVIQVRLKFGGEKNTKVAVHEHRKLLKILLEHELETSKIAPFWWSGKFSVHAEAVITQHSVHSGLTTTDCELVQWTVYTQIHHDLLGLSFALFEELLDKLTLQLHADTFNESQLQSFWDGVRMLLPTCFSVVRKLRNNTADDKIHLKMLGDVLSLISKIAMLEPPKSSNLFLTNGSGFLNRDDTTSWYIQGTLQEAIFSGAQDWFAHIIQVNDMSSQTDEDKLLQMIKLIDLVTSDLQWGIEFYEPAFKGKMNFPYSRTCYIYYEEKLSEYIEPTILAVCKNLKQVCLPDENYQRMPEDEEINMGTALFDVYLLLTKFLELGSTLSPSTIDFKINQFPQWFTAGVLHWLDISVYKALIRIEKTIELDDLQPIDDSVKYSSSAVDTLSIFYQINNFWQQLAWPDVEGAYMFVAKIVHDICRCCVFYADRMATRLERLCIVSGENNSETQFMVTRELSIAINNIDYIRESLSPFVKELSVDDIICKLADCRSGIEADRCADTLRNVIENAIDTEKNKILELIEIVAQKMSPSMQRFLTEGAELLHQDSNAMDRLMMYLEDSMSTLNSELNEMNFERALDTIWTELSTVLYELLQSSLEKRRPPLFFSNLRDCLALMVHSFKSSKQTSETESSSRATLEFIDRQLQLHGFETSELINQYYLDQHKAQIEMSSAPFGQLTVRCWFRDNILEIDVMNARELIPMDNKGFCDPFIRIHFIPEEKFSNINKPKTSARSKTLFPLFDEIFTVSLTPEQRNLSGALVLFSVKDKDMFGINNQYIAECYVRFDEISTVDEDTSREQIHMKLSRPKLSDTDCIRTLEHRQGDKQAKDFLKKLRQKDGSV